MPEIKEAVGGFLNKAGDFGLQLTVAGAGGAAAGLPAEFSSAPLQANLVLLQEFHGLISGSAELLESHGYLLPQIKEDIAAVAGQVETIGFDYRAAVWAALGIMTFRTLTTPFLVEKAREASEAGNQRQAERLLLLDKFWLATQTFFLANALNVVFKGGPANKAEESLALVGGVVFLGSLLLGIGKRVAARKREKKELI